MRKENTQNFMSFNQIATSTSDRRRKEIVEELDLIKSDFNANDYVLKYIYRFYERNNSFKIGEVIKCFKHTRYILDSDGLSDKEIEEYINIHYIKLINKVNQFKFRMAILNKCGLLDKVLFSNPYILSYGSTISANLLYSYAESKSFNIDMEDLNKLDSMLDNDAKELKNTYPLAQDRIDSIYSEFIESVKKRKEENNGTLKLKK